MSSNIQYSQKLRTYWRQNKCQTVGQPNNKHHSQVFLKKSLMHYVLSAIVDTGITTSGGGNINYIWPQNTIKKKSYDQAIRNTTVVHHWNRKRTHVGFHSCKISTWGLFSLDIHFPCKSEPITISPFMKLQYLQKSITSSII